MQLSLYLRRLTLAQHARTAGSAHRQAAQSTCVPEQSTCVPERPSAASLLLQRTAERHQLHHQQRVNPE
jgi:hypothetical protein